MWRTIKNSSIGNAIRSILVLVMWFGSQGPCDVLAVVGDAQDGWTALIVAAHYGHSSTVALLLEKGTAVDQANKVR